MATRILIRRDTTRNWETANPILAAGEPALDIDTGYVRYGDSVTPYLDLPIADELFALRAEGAASDAEAFRNSAREEVSEAISGAGAIVVQQTAEIRDQAVAAQRAAEAVGATTDTQIAGQVSRGGSATRAALGASFQRVESVSVLEFIPEGWVDTQDATAFVQAALDRAAALPGRVKVIVPSGYHFRCNRATSNGGFTYALRMPDPGGIHVTGGGTISSTCPRLWRVGANSNLGTDATQWPILPAAKGDSTVTTATPADAGNLAAGDWILVRSGSTVAGSQDLFGAPDAEWQQVVAANANTGVVTTDRPLVKSYVQEYFQPGQNQANGATSPTNTGDPSPLAVRKCQPLTDITFGDVRLIHTTGATGAAIFGVGVVGLDFIGTRAIVRGSFHSMSGWGRGTARDCVIHLTVRPNATYWFSTAWGTSDVEVTGNSLSADGIGQMHIFEGSAKVNVHHNQIKCQTGVVTDAAVVHAAGRGYDIKIDDNDIMNGGEGPGSAAIRVGPNIAGGTVKGNSIHTRAQAGVVVDSPTVAESDNTVLGATQYGTHSVHNSTAPRELPFMPNSFRDVNGNAPTIDYGGAWRAVVMPRAVNDRRIRFDATLPDSWRSFEVQLLWQGAASGTVRWSTRVFRATVGAAVNAAAVESQTVSAVTAGNVFERSVLAPPNGFVGGSQIVVEVFRSGTDSTDTAAGDANLIGVILKRRRTPAPTPGLSTPIEDDAAFSAAFAPPPAEDNPTITIAPYALPSGEVLLREARVANGGEVDTAGDPRFLYDGNLGMAGDAANPNNYAKPSPEFIPGGNSQAARYQMRIRTIVSSSNVVRLRLRAAGTTMAFRILVNGTWVSKELTRFADLASGSGYLVSLTFPTAASRTITYEDSGSNASFGGMVVPNGVTLTRPTAPRKKLAVVADSFGGGSSVPPNGATRMETWANFVAKLIGADSFINFSVGGTGWITDNPYSTRMDAVRQYAPDVVVFLGSRNDPDRPADIQAQVDAVLKGIPSVREVYVTGPSTSGFATRNNAVKAGTASAGRRFLDGIAGRWIENNSDDIGTDGVHPTFLGHQKIARGLYNAMVQQPDRSNSSA